MDLTAREVVRARAPPALTEVLAVEINRSLRAQAAQGYLANFCIN